MNYPNQKVLAIFAHPDDETILAGGALALMALQGCDVHYVNTTRGEGGEVGEPAVCLQKDLGNVREGELECAIRALNGASLSFLGYVDPPIGEDDELHPYTQDFDELIHRIAGNIERIRPEIIITHGSNGEYGHPAHLLTYRAVVEVVSSLQSYDPVLYTASAIFPGHPKERIANQDDIADLVVDVSSVLGIKETAARCHKTQNALFVRRSSEAAGRKLTVREVLMDLEGFHQVVLESTTRGDDPLSTLLADKLISTGGHDA